MGGSQSAIHEDLNLLLKEEKWDPIAIRFDDKGNLRYGKRPRIDRRKQLEMVNKVDNPDKLAQNGSAWYVMDSAWVEAWLAYALDRNGICPDPGPCYNYRLLRIEDEPGENHGKLVPRDNLIMANSSESGHFRRVSKEAWEAFQNIYDEEENELDDGRLVGKCGPIITMEWTPASGGHGGYEYLNDGRVDLTSWTIEQKIPKEEKKKRFINLNPCACCMSLLGSVAGEIGG
jgi:hypothetical protein